MRVGRRFIQVTANPARASLALAGYGVSVTGTAPSGGGTTANLSWTAPTLDEAGNAITVTNYILYASTNAEDWNLGTFLSPVTTPTNATSYAWTDASFTTGTTWYYWVRAVFTSSGVTAYGQPSIVATKTF